MTSLLLALCGATGVYLVLTRRSPAPAWSRISSRLGPRQMRHRAEMLLGQVGMEGVSPTQFLSASLAFGVMAMLPAAAVFGFGPSSLIIGGCAACTHAVAWRRRRASARRVARESWPRLIEELRVLTGAVGRSIPQALIEVGLRGPVELRDAFRAAQREWALTTDFERTVEVLKARLGDPTADATFETLLVAAQVGGDIDARLAALAEDRRQDLAGRKEAQAKQAGAKVARIFVILVPLGMALAGLSVGDGSDAYRTPTGQLLVSFGVALVVACWWWASRVMKLPESDRVFDA
ncbi:hypothetical protein BH10ACT3_BH10ACT3_07640 [soil metagenome]